MEKQDVLKTVSKRLFELRLESGENQSQVAEHIGTMPNTVSRYELMQRQPHLDILIRLADYYGVSLDYLAGRTESRGTTTNLPANYMRLTEDEQTLIKRYRALQADDQEILRGKALELLKYSAMTGETKESTAG